MADASQSAGTTFSTSEVEFIIRFLAELVANFPEELDIFFRPDPKVPGLGLDLLKTGLLPRIFEAESFKLPPYFRVKVGVNPLFAAEEKVPCNSLEETSLTFFVSVIFKM